MKKIIAALTLFLAFSINANAQDKTALSPEAKGKNQALELTKFMNLSEDYTNGFTALFIEKFTVLDNKNTSPERKAEMLRVVEAKIRASFDAKQMEKLEKNTDLFKRLIN